MERPTWQGSEGGLHPTACEELSPANHHVSELESGSSLVEPWDHCSPVTDPGQEDHACFPDPQKMEGNKCFKPLYFGVICYTAINNK